MRLSAFLAHVPVLPADQCWPWQGGTHKGLVATLGRSRQKAK